MGKYTLDGALLTGVHSSRPAASAVANGSLYAETDTGQTYQSDGATWTAWGTPVSAGGEQATINFIIDGGGSPIATGVKGDIVIDYACTLDSWTLLADVAGAIVIDVWKDIYANFPPTVGDSMPGSGKEPTIAATNASAQDTSITDWTTDDVAAGDVLRFNVVSCTTITRATLSFKVTRT